MAALVDTLKQAIQRHTDAQQAAKDKAADIYAQTAQQQGDQRK
jgi:hypothetical protein